jgi:ubiquinone/menaquinone biosynthesis C-methylase UbiE
VGHTASDPVAVNPDPPIGVSDWERVSVGTRFGRYRISSQQRAVDLATSLLGNDGQALDIGCGEGRWSFELHRRGWRVVCADVKEDALEVCRSRIPDARIVPVNRESTKLPMSDSSARLVLALEVAAVTQAPWFPSEARRVLEPGGGLVFTFRNPWSWRGLVGKTRYRLSAGRRAGTDASYLGSSYHSFRRSLREQGFRIVHEAGTSWLPLTGRSDSRLVTPFAFIERALGLRRLVTFSPTVVAIAVVDASR